MNFWARCAYNQAIREAVTNLLKRKEELEWLIKQTKLTDKGVGYFEKQSEELETACEQLKEKILPFSSSLD